MSFFRNSEDQPVLDKKTKFILTAGNCDVAVLKAAGLHLVETFSLPTFFEEAQDLCTKVYKCTDSQLIALANASLGGFDKVIVLSDPSSKEEIDLPKIEIHKYRVVDVTTLPEFVGCGDANTNEKEHSDETDDNA